MAKQPCPAKPAKSKDYDKKLKLISRKIDSYPDFPKPGIIFKDIFGVLKDPEAAAALKDILVEETERLCVVQAIVGLDARGFLFGPMIAAHMKRPFIPVRKKGKLPGKTLSVEYTLEYGEDSVEVQENTLGEGLKVLVIDDLLATGGTLSASVQLLQQAGYEVVGCLVVMEIKELKGRDKIEVPIKSLIEV